MEKLRGFVLDSVLEAGLSGEGVCEVESVASQFRTAVKAVAVPPINGVMISPSIQMGGSKPGFAWAMHMKATSMDEPERLIQTLTGAILGSGGWVLSRGANDSGTINMLFEFERMHCVEIYTVLIAVGLELSQLAHLRFTELCQCTRSHHDDCGGEIVSVDLEIHSFAQETIVGGRSASEAA